MTMGQFTDRRPFSHRVICGCCGHTFSRRQLTRSWGKIYVWECGQIRIEKGKNHCPDSDTIYEKELYAGFVEAWNKILSRRKTNMRRWDRMIENGNALEKIRAKQFIEITEGMKPLTEIDLSLVSKVFDHCIYYNTGDTEYHFLDGTVITLHTKGDRRHSK
jgi:site-specific DNA recombinase